MEKDNISKEDLFNVIKHGHAWHAEKIKEELGKLMIKSSNYFNHDFRYDTDDKFYYIYDNECYLFILDGAIELRSDRDNVFSTNKTFTHDVRNADDIVRAYEHFKSLLIEDEEG